LTVIGGSNKATQLQVIFLLALVVLHLLLRESLAQQ
jgi:hypothetical protein